MICFPWEREVGDPSVLEASEVDGATSSWCQAPPPRPLTSQLHHKATNPIPGQPLVVVGALFCLSFLGNGAALRSLLLGNHGVLRREKPLPVHSMRLHRFFYPGWLYHSGAPATACQPDDTPRSGVRGGML